MKALDWLEAALVACALRGRAEQAYRWIQSGRWTQRGEEYSSPSGGWISMGYYPKDRLLVWESGWGCSRRVWFITHWLLMRAIKRNITEEQ